MPEALTLGQFLLYVVPLMATMFAMNHLRELWRERALKAEERADD